MVPSLRLPWDLYLLGGLLYCKGGLKAGATGTHWRSTSPGLCLRYRGSFGRVRLDVGQPHTRTEPVYRFAKKVVEFCSFGVE
jgi:hypothetical protein